VAIINLVDEAAKRLDGAVIVSTALDSLVEGVIVVDDHGRLVVCNPAALLILGLTPPDDSDLNLAEIDLDAISADGAPYDFAKSPDDATLKLGAAPEPVTVGISAGGHERRWVTLEASPVMIGGELKGVLSIFVDVTSKFLRSQILEILPEVNRFVMFPKDSVDILQHLCEVLVTTGGYKLAYVAFPVEGTTDELTVAHAAGATGYLAKDLTLPFAVHVDESTPLMRAVQSGQELIQVEQLSVTTPPPFGHRSNQFGLGAAIGIPFNPGGRKAVLAVYTSFSFATSPARVDGLRGVLAEVEFGIRHLESVARLAKALDGTLLALGLMTESRDPYTAGHQSRVGALGAAIATKLGLDSELVKLIRQSGDVHDIGKIAVPAEILTRPGRLSHIEFEIVKMHTMTGFRILSGASVPWPIAEVARDHHERLDGSGYPSGLVVDEIILPARIIAVADVVEAMTQHRPYRPALGLEAALAEIASGSGTLYDREVVESCLSVFASGFNFEADPVMSVPIVG